MANEAGIKIELDTDPVTIGYAGMNDKQAADAMNDPANDTAEVVLIPTHDIFNATVYAEWAALTDAEKGLYAGMLGMVGLDLSGSGTRSMLGGMFGAGTTTRDNLIALQDEPQSRSQILGFGRVSEGDVLRARALP